MKKSLLALTSALAVTVMTGCAYFPGGTDLSDVAEATELDNITTGDGTFENYTATGHYTGTELGIAIGLPGLIKLFEIYPMQSNEGLLEHVAGAAKDDGADAMINTTPHKGLYIGFPFGIVGLYIDQAMGTGIKTKM